MIGSCFEKNITMYIDDKKVIVQLFNMNHGELKGVMIFKLLLDSRINTLISRINTWAKFFM